jgi:hypothetical protein
MPALALFAVAALVVLAEVVAVEYADPDLWGRLSAGAVWFQAGHIPKIEDFSYTAAGARWIDHEWLAGAIFYAALDGAGEPGLVLLKYGLVLAGLAAVFALVRLHGGSAYWALFGIVLTSPVFILGYITTLRAQAFSFPLFLWTLWLLERVRLGRSAPRRLWLLVPLAIVWGNAHGGFVMGVLAVAVYAGAALLERRWRAAVDLAGLALGMFAAVALVNPYGLEYGSFLIGAWTLDRSLVTEWKSLLDWPLRPFEMLALAMALGAGALASFGGWRAWRARDLDEASALAPSLVLLLLVVMTLQALRIQTFLALTLAGLLPLYLGFGGLALSPGLAVWMRSRGPAVRVALPAVLAASAALYLGLVAQTRPLLSALVPQRYSPGGAIAYPAGAVAWLRNSPFEGRLLNPFTQGEFLLWTLYPKFRVALDGRYEEVYTQQQFRETRRFFLDAPLMWHRQLAFAQRTRPDRKSVV